MPTQEEILQRLNFILGFIEANLMRFTEFAVYWHDQKANSEERIAEKILCEAAWLILLCRRINNLPHETNNRIFRIADQLNTLIRNQSNLALAMRNPQFASAFAIAHFALTDMGKVDPVWDRIVRNALETKRFDTKERYPHRILERIWVLSLYGYDSPVHGKEAALLSILHSDAHPITMTENDAYAFTHAPMYLTDFGRDPLPAYLDTAHISATNDACIAWHIIQRNYDLLGEFLLVSLLIDQHHSVYFELGFSVFMAAWDELGFLPSPSFDQGVYSQLTEEGKPAYAFAELYHTNLVGGLICAVWLSNGSPRVSSEPASSTVDMESLVGQMNTIHVMAEQFAQLPMFEINSDLESPMNNNEALNLALSYADGLKGNGYTRTHKWSEAIRANALPQSTKLVVLLDGLLIMSIRQYNLGLLQRTLVLGVMQSLSPSPTFAEAIRFLGTQQLPSGAIGAHFLSEEALNSDEARIVAKSFAISLSLALIHMRHDMFQAAL